MMLSELLPVLVMSFLPYGKVNYVLVIFIHEIPLKMCLAQMILFLE
jgi:hypothetical protein